MCLGEHEVDPAEPADVAPWKPLLIGDQIVDVRGPAPVWKGSLDMYGNSRQTRAKHPTAQASLPMSDDGHALTCPLELRGEQRRIAREAIAVVFDDDQNVMHRNGRMGLLTGDRADRRNP